LEAGTVAPTSFTMRNMAARLDAVGDLWRDLLECRQTLKDSRIA